MDANAWLEQHAPGFKYLTTPNRQALFHFLLLWTLYENKVHNTNASAGAILVNTRKWDSQGKLDATNFASEIQYFRSRCFENGSPNEHFAGLKLRNPESLNLVRAVLAGENSSPADSVAALLIVVYRLRNNLFHGAKWNGEIQNQHANFTHANNALITALKIAEA